MICAPAGRRRGGRAGIAGRPGGGPPGRPRARAVRARRAAGRRLALSRLRTRHGRRGCIAAGAPWQPAWARRVLLGLLARGAGRLEPAMVRDANARAIQRSAAALAAGESRAIRAAPVRRRSRGTWSAASCSPRWVSLAPLAAAARCRRCCRPLRNRDRGCDRRRTRRGSGRRAAQRRPRRPDALARCRRGRRSPAARSR